MTRRLALVALAAVALGGAGFLLHCWRCYREECRR